MLYLVRSTSELTFVAVGALLVTALTLLQGRRRRVKGFCLPPGPIPLPVVGNFFSIDRKKPWVTYTEWKARHGDIFMIRMLKKDIVVINSEKIARDLLERRSNIYSDRPYLTTRVPYGWSFNLAFTPYGDQWRSKRKIFNQAFRAEAALGFHPVQLKHAHQLALDILSKPHDFYMQNLHFAAAMMLSLVYDYDVTGDDHLVETFGHMIGLALEGMTPETSSIVEAFPFVLSLPEWLPGGSFRRKAKVCHVYTMQLIEEPFKYARDCQATGTGESAAAFGLLKHTEGIDDPSQLQLLKETCATAFIAGAAAIASTLLHFMLAMVQNPEVQERAHAEIDAVVGSDRLPMFDDRPNLPYIEAILMEILRMYTIVPLGIAHATVADDVYEDLFIPKGCTVVANVWSMCHDEVTYPEPNVFKPERFFVDGKLIEDMKFVNSLSFGFGRRLCPGRHVADGSIWAAVISILWACKISKASNEKGEEVDFEPAFSYGFATLPLPFPCSIVPRQVNENIHELSAAEI
ncbi:cytochrome P450 [Chiua virens]|nr:cytochrome P450 [Chiua virens]